MSIGSLRANPGYQGLGLGEKMMLAQERARKLSFIIFEKELRKKSE